MGKTIIALGSAAVSLFIAATRASPNKWYVSLLWIGFGIAFAFFLFLLLLYLALLFKKYLSPLDIRDIAWWCTYWPTERQLKVTLWFGDRSGASAFKTHCTAQFGQKTVACNDKVVIGGTYMGEAGLVSGRNGPIMAEFFKYDVDLDKPSMATVIVRMKPSSGIWVTKEKSKEVPVQVIGR